VKSEEADEYYELIVEKNKIGQEQLAQIDHTTLSSIGVTVCGHRYLAL